MLRGSGVLLRARKETDVPTLHRELYEDVATRSRADNRAWVPQPLEHSTFRMDEPPPDTAAVFTIADPETDQPLGSTLLWGIDRYNRSAHIGLALVPAARGRRLAKPVLELLCEYAFQVLGLHRLGLETLSDNEPMIRAAQTAGFVREGTLRQSGWVYGQWLDDAIFGLLAAEWREGHRLG